MKKFSEWLRLREGAATGPYIGGCGAHKDFIVQGACSQLNSDKENERYRKGDFRPKKRKSS